MARETLYHGTNGDNILGIIESGKMRPGADGRIFFARDGWASALMHGGDRKRRAAFAIKVQVDIPEGALLQRVSTQGVKNTWVITTTQSLSVTVGELFVRNRPGDPVTQILGAAAISAYLTSRQGPEPGAPVE